MGNNGYRQERKRFAAKVESEILEFNSENRKVGEKIGEIGARRLAKLPLKDIKAVRDALSRAVVEMRWANRAIDDILRGVKREYPELDADPKTEVAETDKTPEVAVSPEVRMIMEIGRLLRK